MANRRTLKERGSVPAERKGTCRESIVLGEAPMRNRQRSWALYMSFALGSSCHLCFDCFGSVSFWFYCAIEFLFAPEIIGVYWNRYALVCFLASFVKEHNQPQELFRLVTWLFLLGSCLLTFVFSLLASMWTLWCAMGLLRCVVVALTVAGRW